MEHKNSFNEEVEQSTEQERRARLISRYIEKIIAENPSADEEEEKDIREDLAVLSAREKADRLYEKLMAYRFDKQAETKSEPNPSLISEIKVFFEDESGKRQFDEMYGEARIDAKIYRLSEMGNVWENVASDLSDMESRYKKIERDVFLDKIEGRGNVSVAKSKLERLAKKIITLEKEKENLRNLEGLEHTEENTDAVAMFQY